MRIIIKRMQREKIVIGFDAKRALCNRTGLGSYSRTLINDIVQACDKTGNVFSSKDCSFYLYSPKIGQENLKKQIINRDNIKYIYPKHPNNSLLSSLWREKYIVRDLIKDNISIYHGLSGELPINIKRSGVKTIVTIHDVIFFSHPEWYSSFDVRIYKHKFFSTLRQADKIIAISECTKRDILKYGNTDPLNPLVKEEDIEVIYQSYNNIFNTSITEEEKTRIKQKYSLPNDFVLNVGTIEKRKNILLAVEAISQLPNTNLIIIGRQRGEYANRIKDYILKHSLQTRVRILENIPNEELKVFYSMAKLFVYPSIYEGFGIPIVEAIANNLPVVAAKGSCLEEAGGPDTYYVDPYSVKEMREAIQLLYNNEDKRSTMIMRSREYIKKFNNIDIAQQNLDLYESLLSLRK